MMKTPNRSFLLAAFAVLTTAPYLAAQGNVVIDINGPGGKGSMAVPDFRGSGDAQKFMGTFNQTLWNELDQSGAFRMVPKTSYPLQVPQMPQDFKGNQPPAQAPVRRGAATPPTTSRPRLADWFGPPAEPPHPAFGFFRGEERKSGFFV